MQNLKQRKPCEEVGDVGEEGEGFGSGKETRGASAVKVIKMHGIGYENVVTKLILYT